MLERLLFVSFFNFLKTPVFRALCAFLSTGPYPLLHIYRFRYPIDLLFTVFYNTDFRDC